MQDKYALLNASIFIKNTNDVFLHISLYMYAYIFKCATKHRIVEVKMYKQLIKSSDPLYIIDIARFYFVNTNLVY